MFKIIQTNKINSNVQNEKTKIYKGLILDDVTFSQIKICVQNAATGNKTFSLSGPQTVSYDETESLREINGSYGKRAMMIIEAQNEVLDLNSLHYLFNPSFKISASKFDSKRKIWLISSEILK